MGLDFKFNFLKIVVFLLVLTFSFTQVSAINDPGHDSLYVELTGDTMTGPLNVSNYLNLNTANAKLLFNSGGNNIIIGTDDTSVRGAPYSNQIAIGAFAKTYNSQSIAIGYNSNSTGYSAISIGEETDATNNYAIALGYGAQATGENSIAIGKNTFNNEANLFKVGGSITKTYLQTNLNVSGYINAGGMIYTPDVIESSDSEGESWISTYGMGVGSDIYDPYIVLYSDYVGDNEYYIGLDLNDDEKFKMSFDGNTWTDSFVMDQSGNILLPQNVSIGGVLDMTSGKITNLANGSSSQDAVTLSQLQAVEGSIIDTDTWWSISGSQYLENRSGILDVNEIELNATIQDLVDTSVTDVWVNTSGDTMSGNLSMGNYYIHNLANGTSGQDAVTKSQLDAVNASFSGDLSDYVPYTDATNNVDLGNHNLTTTGIIDADIVRGGVITCTVGTAAATAAKTCTISNYTLTAGDFFAVTYTLGSTVSSPTLNINGVGAKSIRLGNTAASTTTHYFGANSVAMYYYDGTYFQLTGSMRTSDSTVTSSVLYGGYLVAGETITRYKTVMEGSDGRFYPLTIGDSTGTTKTVSQVPFKLKGLLATYASTTTLNENSGSSSFYTGLAQSSTTYVPYGWNGITHLTNYRPIYLVGTLDEDGYFILDDSTYTSFYTSNLPTTEDGKLYVEIGDKVSTTLYLRPMQKAIYQFKDGRIREYNDDTDDVWNITTSQYLENRSGILDVNESELNATIDSRVVAGSGNVSSITSSTNNQVARFNGTTGLLIQNSSVVITDAGGIQTPNGIWNYNSADSESWMSLSNLGTGSETETPYFHLYSDLYDYYMVVDQSDGDKLKIVQGYQNWSGNQFVMTPSGDIGIGTSTPSSKLEINGSALIGKSNVVNTEYSLETGAWVLIDGVTGQTVGLDFTTDGTISSAGIQYLDSTGDLEIWTANTGIRVTSSSNVEMPYNVSIGGVLDMTSGKITNLANGTSGQDAVTLSQLQAVEGSIVDTDTWWSISGSQYLYNDSNVLKVNESKLNATIELLDTDTNTWWGLNEGYIYNNSNNLDFNETLLNATIDSRIPTVSDVWVNTSGDTMSGNLNMNANNITNVKQITFNSNQINIGGVNTVSSGAESIAIGEYSNASGQNSVAIGAGLTDTFLANKASGIYSIALGYASSATGGYDIALGSFTNVNAINAIAIGYNAGAIAQNALALGYSADATQAHAIALGSNAVATAPGAIALGNTTQNAVANSFKVGGSVTHTWLNTTLNISGTTDIHGTLDMNENLISNLANGTSGQDAVTLSQLQAVEGTIIDTDTWWSISGSQYLYNDSNVLKVNESKLNATIELLDTDTNTWWGLNEGYIYNNSNSLDFNETLLNATIDSRVVAGSGNVSSGASTDNAIAIYDGTTGTTIQSSDFIINDSNVMKVNDGKIILNSTTQDTLIQFGDISDEYSWNIGVDNSDDSFNIFSGTEPLLKIDYDLNYIALGTDLNFYNGATHYSIENISQINFYDNQISLGYNTNGYTNSIAIGESANINSGNSIAIGTNTESGGSNGMRPETLYNNSIAIGTDAQALETDSIAIGHSALSGTVGLTTPGQYSIAIGSSSTASQNYAIALGYNTDASAANAIALGANTNNAIANSFKVGGSVTHTWLNTTLNISGTTDIHGTLDMNENLISNLANGTSGQDAVTLSQLQEVNSTISDTNTQWDISTSEYLENRSGILDINESKLNATIELLDTDTNTWWGLNEGYIYNNSNNLDFNETLLNATIQDLVDTSVTDVWVNTSGDTMTGNLSMGGNYIKNLANGTSAQDAVTLSQLQAVNTTASSDDYIGNSGTHTAGGNLNMNANNITNVKKLTFDSNKISIIGDATGTNAIAIGISSLANQADSITIGRSSIVTSANGISIGQGASSGSYGTALNSNSNASGTTSLALGYASKSAGYSSVAIGRYTTSSGTESVAIGGGHWNDVNSGAQATNSYAIAIGFNTSASGANAVALGVNTKNAVANSFKVGGSVTHTFLNTTLDVSGAIDFHGELNMNSVNKITNLANGTSGQDAVTLSQLQAVNTTASSDDYIGNSGTHTAGGNLDMNSNNITNVKQLTFDSNKVSIVGDATGTNAIAIGSNSSSTYDNSIALGYQANANQGSVVAIGYNAVASAQYALALGRDTIASGTSSIALGTGTQNNVANSLKVGSASVTHTFLDTTLDVSGATSIGGTLDMNENLISNLANGTSGQDAVTLSQLLAINSSINGDLENYVPYSGATSNLDLNNKNLTNVNKITAAVINATTSLNVGTTFVAESNGDVRIGI